MYNVGIYNLISGSKVEGANMDTLEFGGSLSDTLRWEESRNLATSHLSIKVIAQ